MISYEDFLKNPQDVVEFQHQYGVYRKDNRARASLNATLETNYVSVFRHEREYKAGQWTKDNIDLSGEEFYIVTAKGKILHHTNSEWGGIGVAKQW